MAGDLDGGENNRARTVPTAWQTGLNTHSMQTENREGLFLLFYPSAPLMSPSPLSSSSSSILLHPFCPNNMSESDIPVVNDTDDDLSNNKRCVRSGGGLNPAAESLSSLARAEQRR